MELSDIDYPLPAPLAELLEALVSVATPNKVLSLHYSARQSTEERQAFDLVIAHPAKGDNVVVSRLKGRPIEELKMVGLVEPLSDSRVFIYPAGFERARYESENWSGKLWIRLQLQRQRTALVVVGFATFVLVILQIFQLIHSW